MGKDVYSEIKCIDHDIESCVKIVTTKRGNTADGRVDEGSLAQLMDWYIEVGVDGAVVLGNSSEVEQLTDDEKFRIIEVAVLTSRSRIPVVAGITSTGVYVSQYLNKKAADLGASAVMLAPSSLGGWKKQSLNFMTKLHRFNHYRSLHRMIQFITTYLCRRHY